MSEPRICPSCKVNELPPRYRKCDDCLSGIPVSQTRTYTRAPEVALLTVVSSLRRVPVRPVDLYCTCRIETGVLWPGDDAECPKHGKTWVTRVTR